MLRRECRFPRQRSALHSGTSHASCWERQEGWVELRVGVVLKLGFGIVA